ncbi:MULTISPECIES: DUF4307 domain-containing protein [Saccharopolyspora]|uniref:DUF4307 domain-containing protein n=1 Tax=Saccharopolyspora cebuensis TaxID=418759 RepID=A0ABV4CAY7_9PSEU
MTHQPLPEGRYGSRARARTPRPGLRWLFGALAAVVLVGASVIGYQNLGSAPVEGEHVAYDIVDDRHVRITLEVRRDEPQRPAACVVRAREKSGAEVGRGEVFIPPADGTVRHDVVLRTSAPPGTGEVYGCTYKVPEYLSTPSRPIG